MMNDAELNTDGRRLRELVRYRLLEAGAAAVGFARAGCVSGRAARDFESWLQAGNAGELTYMHSHRDLRLDPRLLLEGAQTIVCCAWLYNPAVLRPDSLPYLARYAYSRDYHKALRSLLRPIVRDLEELLGCSSRICIDSAPVMERYWAVMSGIGFCGRSGLLIVPGVGSRVFLTEILLTTALPADEPCSTGCGSCMACVRVCPGDALSSGASPDCRRCLSALTIEKPGSAGSVPRRTLAGCDVCQDVCPHNRGGAVSALDVLRPLPQLMTVDAAEIEGMNEQEFRERFAGTPLMRVGLQGLQANLRTPVRK